MSTFFRFVTNHMRVPKLKKFLYYNIDIRFIKIHLHTYIHTQRRIFFSNDMALSFHTLPVEMIYRILDNLDDKTMFTSMRNVCQRLNTITDSYHRYQVKLYFSSCSKSILFYEQKIVSSFLIDFYSNQVK